MSKAKTDPLARPDNQIHWTPTLKKKIPVLRGVHTPPLPKIKLKPLESGYIEQLIEVIQPLNDAINLINSTKEKDRDEAFTQKLETLLPDEEKIQKLIHTILINRYTNFLENETALFTHPARTKLTWIMKAMLQLLGTEKTATYWLSEILKLPLGLSDWKQSDKLHIDFFHVGFDAFSQLQRAISVVDEASYKHITQSLGNFLDNIEPHLSINQDNKLIESYKSNQLTKQVLLASLFPEVMDKKKYKEMVLNSSVKRNYGYRYSPLPVEQWSASFAWQYPELAKDTTAFESTSIYVTYCLNKIHNQGINAWELIQKNLQSVDRDTIDDMQIQLLPLIEMFHCQDAIDFCISKLSNRKIQAIFVRFQTKYPIFALQRLLASQTDKKFEIDKDNKAIAKVLLANSLDKHPEHRQLLEQQLSTEANKQLQKLAPISNFNNDELPDILKVRPWSIEKTENSSVVPVKVINKNAKLTNAENYQIVIPQHIDMFKSLSQNAQRLILSRAGIKREQLETVIQNQTVSESDFTSWYEREAGFQGVFLLPKSFAFSIWTHAPIENIKTSIWNLETNQKFSTG